MDFVAKRQVERTPEFDRIASLPRRTWPEDRAAEVARRLTEYLRTPSGEMTLRPVQGVALAEMASNRGWFGAVGVGKGKTLISLLAATVLKARNAILLLPAALVEKTEVERGLLAKHWQIKLSLKVVSYEMLGREQHANMLTGHRPDLIIADEAHRLKNKRAGVTRRVSRYMAQYPETQFCAMSGTMMKDSLKDFGHILKWCLKHGAPIPLVDGELEEWAEALDENVLFRKVRPGALLSLAPESDQDPLTRARLGFRNRLLQTPGVVATTGDAVDASIYVQGRKIGANQATEEAFKRLRTSWETPDGWMLSEAVEVWRVARQLALGMWYVWDPRPPEPWLEARRNWAKFVRDTLSRSRTMDTELQVHNACLRGDLRRDYWEPWQNIRDTFKPNQKALWQDETALKWCSEWLAKPGICWVEHTWFGERLSRETGLPYYGAQGLDRRGVSIMEADPEKGLIASIAANSTGRNLQAWSRNLVTSWPQSALAVEQMIGRTHREGQAADSVEVDFLLGCAEHLDAFWKSLAKAKMARDTLGQPQKILLADTVVPAAAELAGWPGFRWQRVIDSKEATNIFV